MRGRSIIKIRVPYAPLAEYLEQHEIGVAELLPRIEKEDEHGETVMVSDPAIKADLDRWHRRLCDSADRGWIDYFHADEICCDLIGKHPMEVFGMAWFDYPEDTKLQDRLAGREEKEAA